MADNINTTVDGVRAVELFYRSIKETVTGDTVFYRTELRLNSPKMGTMLPDKYLAVLENSDRCLAVFRLAFVQLLQALKKFSDRSLSFDWISIYMPVRYLKRSDAITELEEMLRRVEISPEKICFEISPSLFEESGQSAAINMQSLRDRGFHFMLTGYAGEYFSMIKLADYTPDLLMLSPTAAMYAVKDDRSKEWLRSLISAAGVLDVEIIADDIANTTQLSAMKEIGCLYYTGPSAGNYMAERYMRSHNDTEN